MKPVRSFTCSLPYSCLVLLVFSVNTLYLIGMVNPYFSYIVLVNGTRDFSSAGHVFSLLVLTEKHYTPCPIK